MTQTIQETIKQLHGSLKDYIEATYHISDAALIDQRKKLLDRPGVIYQVPYLESTPRYQTGERFEAMNGLPGAALEAYLSLSKAKGDLPAVLYNPPYEHQSKAIRHCLIDGRKSSHHDGHWFRKNGILSAPDTRQTCPRSQIKPFDISGADRGPCAAALSHECPRQRPTRTSPDALR